MKITGQQIDLCRDIADAILMAVYYLNSRLKIKIEIA